MLPSGRAAATLRRANGVSVKGAGELRHRIVAARVARVAVTDALDAQPGTLDRTVFLDGFARVLRTGRREAALAAEIGRQRNLIDAHEAHEKPLC